MRGDASIKRDMIPSMQCGKTSASRFIREVNYPELISNVVMVKKANKKWKMSVGFTDLNKTCPETASLYKKLTNSLIQLLVTAAQFHGCIFGLQLSTHV